MALRSYVWYLRRVAGYVFDVVIKLPLRRVPSALNCANCKPLNIGLHRVGMAIFAVG